MQPGNRGSARGHIRFDSWCLAEVRTGKLVTTPFGSELEALAGGLRQLRERGERAEEQARHGEERCVEREAREEEERQRAAEEQGRQEELGCF